MNGLQKLRELFPWPEQRPALPPNWHGWFSTDHERLLSHYLSSETRVVIELGAWMGLSTRFLLRAAPNATVISVDHWQGSPEHLEDPQLATLVPHSYKQFLANLWEHRARLVPLQTRTIYGMELVRQCEIAADLVYVDAAHDTESVLADLELATSLFPDAKIVGDDWNWPSVRVAVALFANEWGLEIEREGTAWALRK